MINIDLDDKYEVIRTLHQSAATAVILVRHKKIGALRILKAISKASPNANSILSEANLLQGINSSLFPTIFEVEENEQFYYLIEEYIDGLSLREYLLCNKITKEELIEIAIKICELIEVLHTAGNEPMLYRDMKPEHVIMQDGKLRLIDFGITIKKSKASTAPVLGTPGWAPKEQLNGNFYDERCDVYGVGKVIEFMQINSYGKDDLSISRIIKKATAENILKRTKDIKELKQSLIKLQGSKENGKEKRHLEKVIAVVGAVSGVGTTHIAIAMTRFFNQKGINAYYKDLKKNTVNELWKNLSGARIKEGILYHDSFSGLMNYGEATMHYQPPIGVQILDCGIDIGETLIEADLIIYVTSGTPWQLESKYPDWLKDNNVYVIDNFSNKLTTIKKAKDISKRIFMYPMVKQSLRLTKNEERVFQAIINNEKDFKN